LVTAGPTLEPIDPVRFIGNHSSGKMGFAIAESLANNGAQVELVSGPVSLSVNHSNIHRTNVNTAEEMYQECMRIFPKCRGAILSAAVADYRPENKSELKIKKNLSGDDKLQITLVRNKDILASLGTIKANNQLLIGFSLETHDELKFAREKMERKNCDMIIMNSLNDQGACFSFDTNKISILTRDSQSVSLPLKTKKEVAKDIVDFMITRYF
jgi:phosphopantothenoylcysteine decarboxylase / phosphopantothenate---cysteine ligase